MKLNNIDLNKLNVFFKVMEMDGYAGASKELNVTKSAVSQSITSLEAHLGTALFLRKSKKLIPTSKARLLFKDLNNYQDRLLESLTALNDHKVEVSGLIKIGSYLEFAKKELSPFLKTFLSAHKKVQIKLKFESPSRLRELLETNKIDMAFSIYPVNNIKGITSKKILKEELVMICKKGHKKRFETLDDFLKASYVAYYSDQKSLKRWMTLHFSKRIKTFNSPLYAATSEMVVSAVKEGIGIGVVPDYLVDKDLEVLRPSNKKLEDYIWLNHYKDQFANSGHKAFVESIEKDFDKAKRL
jgi:DNA-binding transcriptional LysR family regulator